MREIQASGRRVLRIERRCPSLFLLRPPDTSGGCATMAAARLPEPVGLTHNNMAL
ncbi:MAG: hypothetical protein IJV06_11300 [Bacteroidaceae bacterium]|nr:hypothetical protein [Bacteroidaceae bacterium]